MTIEEQIAQLEAMKESLLVDHVQARAALDEVLPLYYERHAIVSALWERLRMIDNSIESLASLAVKEKKEKIASLPYDYRPSQ